LALFFLLFSFTVPLSAGSVPLSLHDALPIWPSSGWGLRSRSLPCRGFGLPSPPRSGKRGCRLRAGGRNRPDDSFRQPEGDTLVRSEEHTSELQSRGHLVCRLLLEKKKNKITP